SIHFMQQVSIIESANWLARKHAEEYNIKMKVFQAFCAKFEEAAKQFTTGLEREIAPKFADSFLNSWNQALISAKPTSAPTHSSVAASRPPADKPLTRQYHHQQQTSPHRQGQPTPTAPPREDLCVFIRLEAE
ncbi:hypothetical protein EDB80DRAFT_817059, partial [Ilyonectria destructans]